MTDTTPILYGGNGASGNEERPELRYSTTDKDGVRKVTAHLTRKIHCLAVWAPAIRQSAAFPGQIVEVDGVGYGAGWTVTDVQEVPDGPECCILTILAEREGVTPFEYEMPPGMSMVMEDGIAHLYYTPTGGSALEQARFDSLTGEDRYGWSVEYVESGVIPTHWTTGGFHHTAPAFDVSIKYEGVEQFHISHDPSTYDATDYQTTNRTLNSSVAYDTAGEAATAGALALPAYLLQLKADAKKNIRVGSVAAQGTTIQIFEDDATVTTAEIFTGGDAGKYRYTLTVPVMYAVYDYDSVSATQEKGVYWESIPDTDSESDTYQHVFYRLRFGNTILMAIDITVAEAE